MAETYRTTLKLRRGYAEVWERNNPVLQEGEPGFALDTKVLKIGDGVTPWLELKGIDSNDGNYDDIISELQGQLIGKPGSGQNSEIFNDSNNTASGDYSHAEGYENSAIGYASHVEGKKNVASGEYQHVQGKYNVEDAGNKYAHIVGGGTEGARKNIHTLDWNGNAWFAGNLKIGGTSPDDPNAKEVFGNESGHSPFYIATDYGISTESENNTPALQALIDMLHAEGGGVIWFPVGTYRFRQGGEDADDKKYAVVPKSGVSIIGESMEGTILKQVDPFPYGMFTRRATADDPLFGCHFERFTVDAYETGDVNQVYGKAFHAKYVRNCVFQDLILRGTTATAMGIDFLDQVIIDNVTCIDCGRTWTESEPGTSGIGIGTGGWENENFTIANCVCVGSGQYGIFIENQTNIFGFDGCKYSKGVVISNCVVRNGLNYGIGIRGGENVTVIGCETYENAKNGVYLDNKCKNVHIMSVSATNNGGHGIRIEPDAESSGIYIQGCNAVGNTGNGIRVSTSCDALTIQGCTTRDNSKGLSINKDVTLNDAVILGNAFLDGWELLEDVFVGSTQYIDVESGEEANRIELTADDLTSGLKLNQDGTEGTSGGGKVTDYLDVAGLGSPITITTDGNTSRVRVAQYDANRVSLVTDAALTDIAGDGVHELTVEKLAGCAYIRLFYSSLDGTNPAVIRSIVVEGERVESGGVVQADWSENDPNAPGYVKTRPCYEEVVNEEIVIELVAGGPTVVDAELCAKLFENKETATYVIDGKIGSFYQAGSIGDGYWNYMVTSGRSYYVTWNGEALAFQYAGTGDYFPGTISFSTATNVVHPLAEKFIPDTIARRTDIPAGGEVWETIIDYTVPEDCGSVVLSTDINGNKFRLKKAHALFVLHPIDGAESLAANVQPAYTFQAGDTNPYTAPIYRYGFANAPRTAGKVTMAAFTLIDTGNGVALVSYKHTGEINYNEAGYGSLATVTSGSEQVNQDTLEYKLREITACSVGGHAKCIGAGTRIKMMGVRA